MLKMTLYFVEMQDLSHNQIKLESKCNFLRINLRQQPSQVQIGGIECEVISYPLKRLSVESALLKC